MFFRSTEQQSGLFRPVHARNGWLMVWKDNVIGFWKRLSPGEWHYVCLCDICDTERVSCCTTTDIWNEKNNTCCDYCQRHAVISSVMDKRWVSWHPLINVKEMNNLFPGKSKFYLLFIHRYFTFMQLTTICTYSCTDHGSRTIPLQRHGHSLSLKLNISKFLYSFTFRQLRTATPGSSLYNCNLLVLNTKQLQWSSWGNVILAMIFNRSEQHFSFSFLWPRFF